jgi:hypothetical protein
MVLIPLPAAPASTEDPVATGRLAWRDPCHSSSSTIEANSVAAAVGGEDGSVKGNNGGG